MIAGSGSLGTLALVATGALRGSKQVVARSVREMVPLPALVFWRWLPAVSLVAWPPLMRAIENRQKQVAEGLAAAEKGRQALEASAKQAEETIADARARGAWSLYSYTRNHALCT